MPTFDIPLTSRQVCDTVLSATASPHSDVADIARDALADLAAVAGEILDAEAAHAAAEKAARKAGTA